MQMLLIATALAGLGLGTAAARAEPVQLDENGLRAVTAGAETAAAPIGLNVNISNPVNVSNQVDVSNQVGTALAVGVNAAVAAFSNNVVASGAATSNIGLSAP